MTETNQGITRRQALKRGLVIGTGVVWATPVVQVIRVSKAYAQTTSPGNGEDVGGGRVEQPPGNGGNGNGVTPPGDGVTPPGDEVKDVVVTQPEDPNVPAQVAPGDITAQAPVTETEAETLPLTGIEVLPLAALGGGLLASGAASLKIAHEMEGSDGPSEPGPEPAEGG